jgi:photosystem II stability/assembly factor-like uncharacterized protein
MKTRLLSLIAGIILPLSMTAQWTIQDPGFTVPKEIKHIHAVDESVVWITAHAGYGQQILSQVFSRTTDGGATWTPGTITTEELSTSMIFALSDQVAFVPMYRSGSWTGQPGLFKTSNGGVTWTRQAGVYTDPTSFPDIVHFFNNNNGITLGDPVGGYFEIYITSNGGTSWTRVTSGNIPAPLASEYATVDNYAFYGNSIWVPTTKGRMLRSTNMGATWAVSDPPYPGAMYTAFYNENQGVIMDHQSWYYTSLNETGDGGVTWSPVTSTGPILNWDITYVPGTVSTLVSTGVVVTNGLSFSLNGGHDWHYAPESEGINFFHSGWIDNNTGWAGGFNEGTGLAFIYKYIGPGLTDLIFSTMSLDFGEVDQGETQVRTVTVNNYGTEIIDMYSIYTDNMDFYSNSTAINLWPGQAADIEVVFQPSYVGLSTGHLIIETNHPELSYIEISLTGVGVDIPEMITDPTEFNLTMSSGEEQIHELTVTNSQPNDVNYTISADIADPALPVLGWNYGSTPLDGDNGILGTSPDQAMMIKDFTVPAGFSSGTLYLGFDDGCRVWINGHLALNYAYNDQWLQYWNTTDDITYYLQEGNNRISVVVFNGVYAGGGFGGFDCQLTVDGIDIIKPGVQYPNSPEAMWYYYGQSGQILVPPKDVNELEWWEYNYSRYEWVKLARATGQQFLTMGWIHQSTPAPGTMLNASPDMAQFTKDIDVPDFNTAWLYLSFDDGCRVWINGRMMFDFAYDVHGTEYWNEVLDITTMLAEGRNRIAVEVYNGIWGGGGGGGFDCQLTVDAVDLIKRGDQNPGAPEAMWYMHGQGGQQLIPALDNAGNYWFTKDYAFFDQPPSVSISGMLPAGNSEVFQVIFDADGLTENYYFANININYENTEALTQVLVILSVGNAPNCEAFPATLDFGETFTGGFVKKMKLSVSNRGSDVMNVSGIFSDDMYSIVADPSAFALDPGRTQDVDILYTNSSEDKYIVKNLNIASDDPWYPYLTVEMVSYGRSAPNLEIPGVDYLYSLLPPDGSEAQNLHIENWGNENSVLNFTLPQAEPLKKQVNPPVKPVFGYNLQIQSSSATLIQRTNPQHYDKDIKSHKSLVTKGTQGKSALAGQIDIFFDDFENGVGDWRIENYMMTEVQWHLSALNSYSPEKSWWCGNETTGDYDNNSVVQEAIISPAIVMPHLEIPVYLEFNEWWEVEEGWDQPFVDISNDGGNTWTRIREGSPGSSGGWITTTLDISAYWNQTVNIRFMFDTGDDIANNFPGWFVDDVRVYFDDFDFLIISPGGGSIPGGQGFDISVTFDASGYAPGWYTGFVLILSNDPNTPQYYLPAYMEVSGSPELQLKVALEGPYDFDGSVYMRTDLNPILPLNQPYNTEPWNYGGTESVPSVPNTDIVDWILLEFRDAPDAASATPGTAIGRQAAFIRNNAMVVNLDGYSRIPIDYIINNQLFIVVWHRNHLGVMTSDPVIPSGGLYSYDFTTSAEKAHGIDAQKNIGDGFYGIYAGDLNASRTIDGNDKTGTWKVQAGKSGYLAGDADMDAQVSNDDKNTLWLPNLGNSCQVPQ